MLRNKPTLVQNVNIVSQICIKIHLRLETVHNRSDIGSAGRAPLYLEEGNQRVHHMSTHGGHVQTGEVGNDNLKLVATKC